MKVFKSIFKQEYALSTVRETVEMVIYAEIAFFIPFLLAHPQILVGTIVNAALVLSALNLRGAKLLPVILLPSLGVVAAGLVFSSLTPFLFYLIPFIWIGNSVLVLVFKKLRVAEKMKYWKVLLAGAAAKTLFLFGSAFALVSLGFIPAPFLTAMGIIQLQTALLGGALAFVVQKAKQ